MTIIGFLLGLCLFYFFLPIILAKRTQKYGVKRIESFKDKTVLSFSLIVPIIFIALLGVSVVGLRITKELAAQGHGDFIYFSLIFPFVSFFIGYLYFKKMVQQ